LISEISQMPVSMPWIPKQGRFCSFCVWDR